MQTFNRHDLQTIDLQTMGLQTTSLRIVDGQLWILDQQALPQRQVWLLADTVALLIEHIQTL